MTHVLPILRVCLAAVFALAGATKVLDQRGARQSLTGFGVPDALVPFSAILLPLGELLTAILLLPSRTAMLGAIGASALLATFIVGIVISLARGRRPPCHCFGQLHSEPVGWRVLVRNGALLVLATAVVVAGWPDGGDGVGEWLLSLAPLPRAVALSVLAGAVGWAVVAVRRAQAAADAPVTVDVHASALPVGTRAPAFSLPDIAGRTESLAALLGRGKPVVLVFIDPECKSCGEVLSDVERWQRDRAHLMTVALLSRGTAEANHRKVEGHAIQNILLQEEREVADAYGVIGTPGVVVIGPDGTVAAMPAYGSGPVAALVDTIESGPAPVPGVGESAPAFVLPGLSGEQIALAQFGGRAVVLLFWDASCVHCRHMLGLLRLWEARPPTGPQPALLVLARGSADDTRPDGFRSPVAIDRIGATAALYGVSGTPSAVLVDADGRIASVLAVGAMAIMTLIGQPDIPTVEEDAMSTETTVAGTEVEPIVLVPGARPIRHEGVHDELLPDGSMVLYNGRRREVLTLNPTAALVWEYCDGEHDLGAIVTEVRDVFAGADAAETDVRSMVEMFLRSGLIDLIQPSAPVPVV